jgi:hypothetical protein
MLRRGLGISLALVVAGALGACGGSEKKAETPSEWVVEKDNDDDSGLEVMQEFGGMNQEKVDRTFKKLYPTLSECLMQGQQRVKFLGGDVQFLVKVDMTGQARHAHIEESNLGDYETEQCMLRAIRDSRWPKPVGGRIGLARSSIGFDPPGDVRPPVQWSSDDVETALGKLSDDFAACGRGGPFAITAYVKTNGSVLSAGVAHSDESGDETARCLVDAVKAASFGSPGSWPAKVTFRR